MIGLTSRREAIAEAKKLADKVAELEKLLADQKTLAEANEEQSEALDAAEAEVEKLRKELAEKEQTITDLTSKVTGHEATIKDLNAKVEEQMKKANAVLAAQGIRAEDLPTGEAAAAPGSAALGILQQYEALTTPMQKAKFYQANKEKIDAANYAVIKGSAKKA